MWVDAAKIKAELLFDEVTVSQKRSGCSRDLNQTTCDIDTTGFTEQA